MIVKEQFIPWRLLADSALLRHLSADYQKRTIIEEDFGRRHAGWLGEKKLGYHLAALPQKDIRIFYDLRLFHENQVFQVDAMLITRFFILILEAKSLKGTIYFESTFNQMIRFVDDQQEGFSNPVVQVMRHKDLLKQWFAKQPFPQIPIECIVAISNASTIIKASPNYPQIGEIVFHAEQIESKIRQLQAKYEEEIISAPLSRQIESALLLEHEDPKVYILKTYSIRESDLLRGVMCSKCFSFEMERSYGTWLCRQCGHEDQDAAAQMILDYFLLKGKTMTNAQCQDFLKINDRYLVLRILKKMRLEICGTGHGKGLYYEAPSQKFYNLHYHLWKK